MYSQLQAIILLLATIITGLSSGWLFIFLLRANGLRRALSGVFGVILINSGLRLLQAIDTLVEPETVSFPFIQSQYIVLATLTLLALMTSWAVLSLRKKP